VLRVGRVCHVPNSTERGCISEVDPCIIKNAGHAGRL
jgi:hypothetical protein